jgi:hypothetical protein
MNDGRKIAIVASTPHATPPAIPSPKRAVAEEVADERGGRQQRAGRELSDRHRIQQLLVRHPPALLDQAGVQVADQHVPAAEQRRTDAEKAHEHRGDLAGAIREP